jgi:FixJ family two-component response regulator
MISTRPLITVLDDEPQMFKALARLPKTRDFETVAFTLGAVDYLLKPLDESQLLAAIRKAMKVGEES